MRGRKGKVTALVPKAGEVPLELRARREAERLRPKGLTQAQGREWSRLAPQLYVKGRLTELFVDVIREYVVVVCRMRELRRTLAELGETYVSEGRQGRQIKSRPEVAQLNEAWRQWARLVAELQMSPAAERNLVNQGDLFEALFAASTGPARHLA